MVIFRKATPNDLEQIWAYNIAQNPGDPRNQRWKESYISRNLSGRAATYVMVVNDEPVGEVTLDRYADAYGKIESRPKLADGSNVAYVTALRIRKEFQGHGHASALMKTMEEAAHHLGISRLTIGVAATESRNLAIYRHWGYTQFIMSEEDDGELVLFYAKTL